MDEVQKKPALDPFAPPPEEMLELALATNEPHATTTDALGAMFEPPAEDHSELRLEDDKPRKPIGPDAFEPPVDKLAPPDARTQAANLEVETYDKHVRPRNPLVARMEQEKAPRAGCRCKKHYDVYLDNDFGSMAAWIGGGFGFLLLALVYWMGPYGALSIGLFGATCGGLATIFSIGLRCEGCRQKVSGLDADEQEWVRRGRLQVIRYTAMFGVFAVGAVCKWLWFL